MPEQAAIWEFNTLTRPGTVEEIQDALAEFCFVYDRVPDAVRFQLSIAVGEVGANIVEHAGGGRRVRMGMELRCSATRVTITFTDDGDPVDTDLDSVTMPGETAQRGRGLAMALSVLGRLSYQRDAAGNRWTLVSQPFG